jgi:hypothetical protein
MPDGNQQTNPLKEFIDKLNNDPEARAQFLSNPVEILRNYGITLSQSAEEGVKQIIEEYRQKITVIREFQGKTVTTTTTTTTTTETGGPVVDFI